MYEENSEGPGPEEPPSRFLLIALLLIRTRNCYWVQTNWISKYRIYLPVIKLDVVIIRYYLPVLHAFQVKQHANKDLSATPRILADSGKQNTGGKVEGINWKIEKEGKENDEKRIDEMEKRAKSKGSCITCHLSAPACARQQALCRSWK